MRSALYLFSSARGPWGWWFRIFGYGVRYTTHGPGNEPLFSERYGHEKVLHIGQHCFKPLRPDNLWRLLNDRR